MTEAEVKNKAKEAKKLVAAGNNEEAKTLCEVDFVDLFCFDLLNMSVW